MSSILAFDIGGTQIKYGLVGLDGAVSHVQTTATPAAKGGPAVLDHVCALAAPLVREHAPIGIAVSTLGLVQPDTGTILGAAEAIPDYPACSPKAVLEQAFGLKVTVENDVNCVALAEGWTGAGQGCAHFIALTVGTGIGGGIVINNALYRGARAAAGEWGYMRIDGKMWERHASTAALVRAIEAATGEGGWSGERIMAAYDGGDAVVCAVVVQWRQLLATGIANLIYAFNPQRVIVGGGISARGERFQQELNLSVDEVLEPDFRGTTEIRLASAGNHAGMIGAARNWLLSNASA
ncbi:ROK family protein [Silvimonas iriomotensis]|uniref:Sugar kinase n=1 Tax=Silvimonas iriomotensis TaxID=449662 RepID=A0ABQ2P5G5_9NEIS|nr:ROK family protein [Silvimonas iriomotensis]GGP18768.1 sugar kinase [Silvimonas iriomotensis]